jgi:hypothetical protein
MRDHPGAARLRKAGPVEFAARLSRARAMDLANLTYEQVSARIHRLMDGYSTKTIVIGTNGVFRARVHPSGVELFENVSELWYPPVSVVKMAGRFNRPGDVRFYASNEIHAALFEAQPKVGDFVSLVVAASKSPGVHLNCTHIGLHKCKEELENRGAGHGPNLQTHPDFQADLRALGIDRKWRRLDDYFSELAVTVPEAGEEQHLYKVTNAIESVLGKINDHNALLYPSVATGLNAFNLALSPRFADEYFFASETWKFEILSHREDLLGAPTTSGGYFEIRPVARSLQIGDEGEIVWGEVSSDSMFDLHRAIARANDIRRRKWPSGVTS